MLHFFQRPRSPFKTGVLVLIWGWMLTFVLLPNVMIIFTSVMTRGDSHFIEWQLTLDNYIRVFDPLYLQVFISSLWMAVITTLICLIIGYPFAFAISRFPAHVKPFLMLLVIIPFWTNSLVRTYALKVLLATKGLLNQSLLSLGLIDTPLRMLYTEGAVILGLVYVLLPFMILPLYAVFDQLNYNYIEAAQDLGASKIKTFWHLVIPLTMPGIIAGSLLVLLPAMGMFYIADLLGGAKHLLIGNLIKNQFLDARDWPFGATASIFLTSAMAILLYAYWRSIKLMKQQVNV
ncbi:spermidine/putrescine transport system permease protein [Allopseudospirillum japonicum]|uniref:Spermidine/putrescine transport system permease protein n=1 Tax=Allopseudospirillum japonicum TaxID=64971 RepID=A0A1H6QBP5_9GAMM|nr:spermidine/putrescine ABC transporter permease PotB [Allopseudospirillum japonicum]SEI37597.1 spermidine/putrescine transport system permease protein [Allopseudospirillum japonicum]